LIRDDIVKTFLTAYEENGSWDYQFLNTDWNKDEMLSFLRFIASEIESGEYIKKISTH